MYIFSCYRLTAQNQTCVLFSMGAANALTPQSATGLGDGGGQNHSVGHLRRQV